jgi:hypothetical protein
MLIWVVEKSDGEPTPDSPGREVWHGGYQGDSIDGVDQLPASLLTQGESGIEVGLWHPFTEFEQAIARLESPEEPWTSLAIATLQSKEEPMTVVQIGSIRAMRLVCTSVMEHIRKFGLQEHGWIRIE